MSAEAVVFAMVLIVGTGFAVVALYFKDLIVRAVLSGFRATPRSRVDSHTHATTTECYYYLNANQQPVGPVQFKVLKQLRDIGAIESSTLAAAQGESRWHPLAEILDSPSRTVPKPPPVSNK